MKENKMSLSIIIVTYNVKALLQECLRSINSKLNIEIIIIDNGDDDTYKIFKKNKKYIYIKNKENVGFGKANNQGFKIAKGKYILLLNPDTKLEKDTLDIMYNYMEKHKNVGMSTCKLLLPDGSLDKAARRSIPNIKTSIGKFFYLSKISRRFSGYNIDEDIDKETKTEAISGAFMFIRRSVIYKDKTHKSVGVFDERFWAMGEDLDLCKRVKDRGWEIMYYPKTSTLHYKGASGGIKKSSQDKTNANINTKKRWIREYYNAMELFYNKYYRKKNNLLTNFITILTIKTLYLLRLIKLLIRGY